MVAHAFLIVCAAAPVSTLLVALAVCAARTIEIGGIAASFSRMRVFTARYAPSTVRRLLFCNISSFLSIVLRAVSIPCGVYHTDAPNVIAGLTTEEYTSLAILKLAPHVDVEMRLIARLYVANFFSILAICGPHFSLESICTPSTLT